MAIGLGIAAIVIGAAATTYQVQEGRRQEKKQDARLAEAEAKAEADQSEIEARQKNAETQAAAATRRRQQQSAAMTGRSGTILTGPMGLGSDSSASGTGTILGGIGS